MLMTDRIAIKLHDFSLAKKLVEAMYVAALIGAGGFLRDNSHNFLLRSIADWLQVALIAVALSHAAIVARLQEAPKDAPTGAHAQFLRCWSYLWATWLMMYSLFAAKDTLMAMSPEASLEHHVWNTVTDAAATTLNNLQAIWTALLFAVMARKTVGPDGSDSRSFKRGLQGAVAAALLLGGVEVAVVLSGSSGPAPAESHSAALTFNMASGAIAGVTFCLFVGRLGSRLLRLPPFWTGLLYLYATIQPLFPLLEMSESFSNTAAPTTLMIVAALLKLTLYLQVAPTIADGRLLAFMKRAGEDYENLAARFTSFMNSVRPPRFVTSFPSKFRPFVFSYLALVAGAAAIFFKFRLASWAQVTVDVAQALLAALAIAHASSTRKTLLAGSDEADRDVLEFTECWSRLWRIWLFLYAASAIADAAPLMGYKLTEYKWFPPLWNLVTNALDNMQSLWTLLLFLSMTARQFEPRADAADSRARWSARLHVGKTLGTIAIFVVALLEFTFAVLPQYLLDDPSFKTRASVAGVLLATASGLFAGVTLSLFAGRLSSPNLQLRSWLIVTLYLYAATQPLFSLVRMVQTYVVGDDLVLQIIKTNGLFFLKLSAALFKLALYYSATKTLAGGQLSFFMDSRNSDVPAEIEELAEPVPA
jgi:hypothetical protein